MSLYTASLNSGSNGNCYLISDGVDTVLVDVGISCKEVELRMERLGIAIKTVKAIFISHEHIDHVSGVSVLSKKYQLPVYITPSTLRNSPIKVEEHLIRPFIAKYPVTIGGLSITGFLKKHDASDPHSFIVEGNGVTIGVFTDIGEVCENVTTYFSKCNAAFLETNYDETLLMNGRYPMRLKRRISSEKGHLSNNQALDLFVNYGSQFLSHLFLSHISKENNEPNLALDFFSKDASTTSVSIAPRYNESELFHIVKREAAVVLIKRTNRNAAASIKQLSLF